MDTLTAQNTLLCLEAGTPAPGRPARPRRRPLAPPSTSPSSQPDPLLAGPAFTLTQHLEAARSTRFGPLARISDSCLTRCDRALLLSLGRDRQVIPAQHDLLYRLRELGRESPHDGSRPWKGYEWVFGHTLERSIPQPAPVDDVAAIYQGLPPEAWAAHGLASLAAA